MDVEDWYHADYLQKKKCDTSVSLLDGLENYLRILKEENVPSSFFVLGKLVSQVASLLRTQSDVGVHGWDHRRPLTLSPEAFKEDVRRAKAILEDQLGHEVQGYRAPCFSLDRHRLDLLQETGFGYDSSRMDFCTHPLYGKIDLTGYEKMRPGIFRCGEFFEFELSILKWFGCSIPVAGGGYFRLLPWSLNQTLLNHYLKRNSFYVFYIHPFELSLKPNPLLPKGTSISSRFRFSSGRKAVECHLRQIIALLRAHGFRFSTFTQVRQEIITARPSKISRVGF